MEVKTLEAGEVDSLWTTGRECLRRCSLALSCLRKPRKASCVLRPSSSQKANRCRGRRRGSAVPEIKDPGRILSFPGMRPEPNLPSGGGGANLRRGQVRFLDTVSLLFLLLRERPVPAKVLEWAACSVVIQALSSARPRARKSPQQIKQGRANSRFHLSTRASWPSPEEGHSSRHWRPFFQTGCDFVLAPSGCISSGVYTFFQTFRKRLPPFSSAADMLMMPVWQGNGPEAVVTKPAVSRTFVS